MQPAMSTGYLNDQSPEEMTQTFADRQWFHLEMASEHAEVLLERGDPAAVGRTMRTFAESRGVSFPQGHLWISCHLCAYNGALVLDKLRRWLDLFVALGIRAAVLHPGGGRELAREGASPEAIQSVRSERLAILCDHVRGTDLSICLENMTGGVGANIDGLLAIIADVDRPNLGICLDTGHLNLTGGDQAGFIVAAGSRLRATHIADNAGQSDLHIMPFGLGTVDWGTVMRSLGAIEYKGLLNFEIGRETDHCPLVLRMAKLDYLAKMMDYLVQLAGPTDR